jgi:tripartite-type tricarboxylate transporter receptor subunit TctC
MGRSCDVPATALLFLLAVGPASGQSGGDIFAGKPLQIIVGLGAGGGYDLWARSLARHVGKHLPGKPAVVVQNMPGAGAINAANHLYAVAPKDGTVIGIVGRDTPLAPLRGEKAARFDATKFSWIGSPASETNVCIAYHTAAVKTYSDLLRHELVVGATGPGTGSYIYPRALNALLGTRFKLITGFSSSADEFLAIERGELEGTCESLDSIVARRPDWIRSGKAVVLLQGGTEPDPALKDVPFILDLARNEEEKQTIRLLYAGQGFGRPFLAPPDLPSGRLRVLRDAFNATMKDAEFIEDARRQKLALEPKDGETLAELAKTIYSTPNAIVERVTNLIR